MSPADVDELRDTPAKQAHKVVHCDEAGESQAEGADTVATVRSEDSGVDPLQWFFKDLGMMLRKVVV